MNFGKKIINSRGMSSLGHIPEPLVDYRVVMGSLSGANIREQVAELKEIRRNSENSNNFQAPKKSIDSRAQLGMYAYRILYYRFIGNSRGFLYSWIDFKMLGLSLLYLRIIPKAWFFFFLRPLRTFISKHIFGDVYLYR